MRCKNRIFYIIITIIVPITFEYQKAYCTTGGRFPSWELSFNGKASGGMLVLARTGNRNMKYVSIQTSPGESAESVAKRLADTINAHHSHQTSYVEYDPHWLWVGGFKARASGSSLKLPLFPAAYVLSGTETGLGIPKSPLSLTCSYDEEKDEIRLL